VKTLLKSVHIYQSYCKKNLAQFFWPTLYIRQTFVEIVGGDGHDDRSYVGVLRDAGRVDALTEERRVVVHVRHSHLYLRLT